MEKENGLLREIVAAGEAQGVGRLITPYSLGRAQNVMAQGMVVEENVFELIENQFRRRVVVALNLVADDRHLLIDFLLRVGAVEDDVGEQCYGPLYVLLPHRRIISGVFLVGEGVEVAAHAFQFVEDIGGLALLRSLEGDMLTEVGQSFFVFAFMAGPGSDNVAAIYHV